MTDSVMKLAAVVPCMDERNILLNFSHSVASQQTKFGVNRTISDGFIMQYYYALTQADRMTHTHRRWLQYSAIPLHGTGNNVEYLSLQIALHNMKLHALLV